MYEVAYLPQNRTFTFFETWASMNAMYRHIYTDPAVARVFFSQPFLQAIESEQLAGPYKVRHEVVPATCQAWLLRLLPVPRNLSRQNDGDGACNDHPLAVVCCLCLIYGSPF